MPNSQAANHYDVLNITQNASQEEIREAYKKRAREVHPDRYKSKGPEIEAEYTEKFKAVSKAYEVLQDADKRAAYDRELAAGPTARANTTNSAPRQPPPSYAQPQPQQAREAPRQSPYTQPQSQQTYTAPRQQAHSTRSSSSQGFPQQAPRSEQPSRPTAQATPIPTATSRAKANNFAEMFSFSKRQPEPAIRIVVSPFIFCLMISNTQFQAAMVALIMLQLQMLRLQTMVQAQHRQPPSPVCRV